MSPISTVNYSTECRRVSRNRETNSLSDRTETSSQPGTSEMTCGIFQNDTFSPIFPLFFVSFLIALRVNFSFAASFEDSCCRRLHDDRTITTTTTATRLRRVDSPCLEYLVSNLLTSSIVMSVIFTSREGERLCPFVFYSQVKICFPFLFSPGGYVCIQQPEKGNASTKRIVTFLLDVTFSSCWSVDAETGERGKDKFSFFSRTSLRLHAAQR